MGAEILGLIGVASVLLILWEVSKLGYKTKRLRATILLVLSALFLAVVSYPYSGAHIVFALLMYLPFYLLVKALLRFLVKSHVHDNEVLADERT